MKRLRQRVQTGTDKDGTPIYTWVSGYNDQDILRAAAKVLFENGQMNSERKQNDNTPLFGTYAMNWFERIRVPSHPKREAEGRGILKNYLLPYFKDKRLGEIRHSDIAAYFSQQHIQRLARETANNQGELLNMIFNFAIKDDLIVKNPCTGYKEYLPKRCKHREALTPDQINNVIAHLGELSKKERLFMSLLIYSGCRRGEALALQVKDIDVSKGTVTITKSVHFTKNKPVIDTPKTKNSYRTIPLAGGFPYELLSDMSPDEYICGNETPLSETAYRHMWARITKKIDVHNATPHIFRHTFITDVIAKGIDLKTAQGLAGHATAYTTMNIYAHLQQDKLLSAKGQLSHLYGGVM